MRYSEFPEAGTLHLHAQHVKFDLEDFVLLHRHLLGVIDEVVSHELYRRYWLSYSEVPKRHRFVNPVLRGVSTGSLKETIEFVLATAIVQPDVRAILQNLAATIIWAIGDATFSRVKRRAASNSDMTEDARRPITQGPPHSGDRYGILHHVHGILAALDESAPDRPAEVTFRAQTAEESIEVTIRLGEGRSEWIKQ